jgi:hypothetical protein
VQSITDIILKKWRNKKLAPFYIIRPPLLDTNYKLEKWSKDLLIKVFQEYYGIEVQSAENKIESGHSDILFINKESKSKQYSIENLQIQELFRMQNYNAKELKHRFIFFNEAQAISVALSNKLLKLLEEPKQDTTIFFLNGSHIPMLSTIESRAITLYLPNPTDYKQIQRKAPQKDLSQHLDNYFKDNNIELPKELINSVSHRKVAEFIEYFTKKKELRTYLLEALGDYMTGQFVNAQTKSNWLTEIQNYKRNEAFNNVFGERIFGLINAAFQV